MGGEAITFAPDGQGYHTVADEVTGDILYHAFVPIESCDPPEARISVSPHGVLHAPVTVTFEGTLQSAASVNGPWTDVDAASPLTLPADQAAQFGRAKN